MSILKKGYEAYLSEYSKALADAEKKVPGGSAYAVHIDIYISMKWQVDNNWNPWDPDAKERLIELRDFDPKLYESVINGLEQL